MKTGNGRQAMILAIVAILSIGFLVYQLMPAKMRPMVLGGSRQAAGIAPTMDSTDNLSLLVIGNPFSHPKLATKSIAPAPVSEVANGIDKSGQMPVTLGTLPYTDSAIQPASGPAESAGKDR